MVRYLFYTIGDLTYQSPLVYCSGIFKFMPRWDRYIDVFEATFNAVNTPHLFLWRIENIRSTEFNNVNPQYLCSNHTVCLHASRPSYCRSHFETSVFRSKWRRFRWAGFRPAHEYGLFTTRSELGTDRCRVFALFYFRESPEVVLSAVFNCHSGPLASSLHHSAMQSPLSLNEPYYFWPVIATRGLSDFSCSSRVNSDVGEGGWIYTYMYVYWCEMWGFWSCLT